MNEQPNPPSAEIKSDIRSGEVAIDLPATFDAGIYFVGLIRTPWRRREDCPKNAREADADCTIEVDPRFAPALKDVEGCSHLIALYWMHEARRDLLLQAPRHLGHERGTFALRSPVRPNPIAVSIVRLLAVDGATLTVRGVDCMDGTPLVDLKPYLVSVDSVPDATVSWRKDGG